MSKDDLKMAASNTSVENCPICLEPCTDAYNEIKTQKGVESESNTCTCWFKIILLSVVLNYILFQIQKMKLPFFSFLSFPLWKKTSADNTFLIMNHFILSTLIIKWQQQMRLSAEIFRSRSK